MADSPHGLSTCRIPLSALTHYYRRNLSTDSTPALRAPRVRRSPVPVLTAEFDAHSAYLEPVTGTGILLTPASKTRPHTADRAHALEQLARDGWTLLDGENGTIEQAGQTTDGRVALCLYAERATVNQLVLEDLQQAITALHTAADLQHDW